MSEPLHNLKQERFACAVVEGKTPLEAMGIAGWKPNSSNISHYMNKPVIRDRIKVLQKEAADNSISTLRECMSELTAQIRGSFSSTIKRLAIESLAKLSGWTADNINLNVNNLSDLSDADLQAIIDQQKREDELDAVDAVDADDKVDREYDIDEVVDGVGLEDLGVSDPVDPVDPFDPVDPVEGIE